MTLYEDDCISIDIPADWQPNVNPRGYYFHIDGCRGVTLIIARDDPGMSPTQKRDGFGEVFSKSPCQDPPVFTAKVIKPFLCGPHTGVRVDRDIHQMDLKGSYAAFVIDGKYVYVQTLGLTSEENIIAWKAISTLRLSINIMEALLARETVETDESVDEPEPKQLQATDLTKPRTRRFKTWMDHQMVLLMDSESYPEDNTFADGKDVQLLTPCNDLAVWLTSQTEWDVTLEFVVRATTPQTRKVWWRREAEATIDVPSGHLHVEQTTGGLLLDIELPAGRYKVIARADCPQDADGADEGVEKIQAIIVPTEESA